MSGQNRQLKEAKSWFEKADHDLRNAEHTLTLKEDCPFDTVCFHAQQCVEKYLKGTLVFKSVDFPKTHDLRILVQLVQNIFPVDLEVEEILPLNRYNVEARYPGDWEPITRREAEKAVESARKICKEIGKHF